MKHPGKEFYEVWADRNLADPERKAVLTWKAVNMANLVLRTLKDRPIHTICEVGGAEGIVLNTIGQAVNAQSLYNYELSTTFCEAGRRTFPNIQFHNNEFGPHGEVYNLIVLSDILEHVEDDNAFLAAVSKRCHFTVCKIPIEKCITQSDMFYKLRRHPKPERLVYGPNHHNGHLRGYTVGQARAALAEHFTVLDAVESDTLFFYGGPRQKSIKRWVGTKGAIWLFGGALFALAKSNNTLAEQLYLRSTL